MGTTVQRRDVLPETRASRYGKKKVKEKKLIQLPCAFPLGESFLSDRPGSGN